MTDHPVATHDEWLAARRQLLAEEKDFTRLRDELSAKRRAMPWLRIDKNYRFDGPEGANLSLGDLFGGRRQLIVYHFMFAPDWEKPCKSCSFWADGYNGVIQHLAQRDTRLVAASRAPLAKLEATAKRMGWTFPWYSSGDGDFNPRSWERVRHALPQTPKPFRIAERLASIRSAYSWKIGHLGLGRGAARRQRRVLARPYGRHTPDTSPSACARATACDAEASRTPRSRSTNSTSSNSPTTPSTRCGARRRGTTSRSRAGATSS